MEAQLKDLFLPILLLLLLIGLFLLLLNNINC